MWNSEDCVHWHGENGAVLVVLKQDNSRTIKKVGKHWSLVLFFCQTRSSHAKKIDQKQSLQIRFYRCPFTKAQGDNMRQTIYYILLELEWINCHPKPRACCKPMLWLCKYFSDTVALNRCLLGIWVCSKNVFHICGRAYLKTSGECFASNIEGLIQNAASH